MPDNVIVRMLRVALEMQTITLEELYQLQHQIEVAILDWHRNQSQIDKSRETMIDEFVAWGRLYDTVASEEQLRAVASYLYDSEILLQSPSEVLEQPIDIKKDDLT